MVMSKKDKIADKSASRMSPVTGEDPVSDEDDDNLPAKSDAAQPAERTSNAAEIAAFAQNLKTMAPMAAARRDGTRGRLVFAMDATMSRQPTWDMALQLQGEMFSAVKDIGGLDVQLMYFRGFGECRASKWVGNPDALARLMTSVSCRGGQTQIAKVLTHGRRETEREKVHALVYVGDAMEEDVDHLCHLAGELSLRGVPMFLFQEGHDPIAERAFREIARLTKGAYCRFDAGSAAQLRELLSAVAVYAAGGRVALENMSNTGKTKGAQILLEQLGPRT